MESDLQRLAQAAIVGCLWRGEGAGNVLMLVVTKSVCRTALKNREEIPPDSAISVGKRAETQPGMDRFRMVYLKSERLFPIPRSGVVLN